MNYLMLPLFVGFGGLAALWCLYAFAYRRYRVDLLREQLFIIRNDLFDHAARGEISFSAEAYKVARLALNGMIRFAHVINLTRIVVNRVFQERYRVNLDAYEKQRVHAIEDLPVGQRRLIIAAYDKAHRAILSHLLVTSPASLGLYGMWTLMSLSARALRQVWRRGSGYIERLANLGQFKNFWPRLDLLAQHIGML